MSSLICSHEEADTNVVLPAKKILEERNGTITIWPPSGDTDIVIVVISLLRKFKKRVILGDGNGKKKQKNFRMSDLDIESDIVDALIECYVFSRNGCIRSFVKGKTCFKQ